jgi:hypothetical protein
MKAIGAAQDFEGREMVTLKGSLDLWKVSRLRFRLTMLRKTAQPSKRQSGGREPDSGYAVSRTLRKVGQPHEGRDQGGNAPVSRHTIERPWRGAPGSVLSPANYSASAE